MEPSIRDTVVKTKCITIFALLIGIHRSLPRTQALLRAWDKDSGTDHVLVNLWLTLYKLTGWLASLDLRQLYTFVCLFCLFVWFVHRTHPQPLVRLFAGMHRTLKIAARTLSNVVNRDRLCGRRTRRNSRGVSEVQSRAVVRRRGGGADKRLCPKDLMNPS